MEQRAESIEKSKHGKTCRINKKLLPFKLHYLFSYGSLAAVIPFLPVIAKQIGINATALGVGYSVKPIFNFLSTPLIGFLVDFFQNIKVFLIALLITSSVSYASILILPPIIDETVDTTYLRVSDFHESEVLLNISQPFDRSCLKKILHNYTECKLVFGDENQIMHMNKTSELDTEINITYNVDSIRKIKPTKTNNIQWITFHTKDVVFLLKEDDVINTWNIQCTPTIHQCSFHDELHNTFSTYQFWIFFILILVASIASMSSSSLSSVACLELLETNTNAYGRQRLFGTIGWGIVCPLSGLLNEYFEKSFISIIYLMAVFHIIDIIILCIIPLPKIHASSNMNRDLSIIFTSKEILLFSLGIAVIGFLTAIINLVEFLFLEGMGANRTLLGLSIFMQCLVGEVPFLFFSGWFVNKLGHFLCFTFVFVGFLLRLIFYFLLTNPWLVLPVDTLHGVTYGLFHGAMTSFANEKAPKGMEATLIGLFCGIYDGLGLGLGSFLGGLGHDKLGPRQTFFFSSMLSLGFSVLFLLLSYIFRRPSEKNKTFQPVSLEIEEI